MMVKNNKTRNRQTEQSSNDSYLNDNRQQQ